MVNKLSAAVQEDIRDRILHSNWVPPYRIDRRKYGTWYLVDRYGNAMYVVNLNGNSKQRNSQRKMYMRFVERCTLERLILGEIL